MNWCLLLKLFALLIEVHNSLRLTLPRRGHCYSRSPLAVTDAHRTVTRRCGTPLLATGTGTDTVVADAVIADAFATAEEDRFRIIIDGNRGQQR